MMGRLKRNQGQFFYSFWLDEVVPDDHRVREIAGVLDLSWVHAELACYYSPLGRPSIDPVLIVRLTRYSSFRAPASRLFHPDRALNRLKRAFCSSLSEA